MINTPFCDQLHAEKYRQPGEPFRAAMNRVADTLGDSQQHALKLFDVLQDLKFMPAGRIQASIGTAKQVTPYNCFVSGTIADSFTEGDGSIMERATEAAQTLRLGGGIGYDFSTLRPRGALIKKLNSLSTGAVSFMGIYNAMCQCIASTGNRRGAQMGVLRVDHPDIEEFIHAKNNEDRLTSFNMSVAFTDEFLQAVEDKMPFDLRFEGKVIKTVEAAELWEKIMRSTWDWAEPGALFIDRINRRNNLFYCEKIAAVNPCGEQPLPPFGACLLGSFNLTRYLSGSDFDFDMFKHDVPIVVRAMDNVIDKAIYPLKRQLFEAHNKRRMGLGVTGLANTIEKMGHSYGSPAFVAMTEKILQALNEHAYMASSELAREKGSFLFFKPEYLSSHFVSRLPEHVQYAINRNGIRNSHLTSIAPTGTISLAADNISSGCEPVFDYKVKRNVITERGTETVTVEDYGAAVLGVKGKRTKDVTVAEHLAVLLAAANNVDSAVSKTCNVPPKTSWESFQQIYLDAWKGGAKGCTTYQTRGKRAGVILEDDGAEAMCRIDPATGKKDCE